MIVESENTEDEYETTDDSEWQHLIAEVSIKHPRCSSSHTDDGKTVVERDLRQHAADRRIQRKVKIADKVMIPQSTTESVKSITSQIQKKQTKGQSVKDKQKMKEISRSKQASPQKSQWAIEVKKPNTSMPKKASNEHLIKNRRHTEAKKLAYADRTNREQPPPSRRVKPDCMNHLGVIHLPTKFSQPPNLHICITSSQFSLLAALALHLWSHSLAHPHHLLCE